MYTTVADNRFAHFTEIIIIIIIIFKILWMLSNTQVDIKVSSNHLTFENVLHVVLVCCHLMEGLSRWMNLKPKIKNSVIKNTLIIRLVIYWYVQFHFWNDDDKDDDSDDCFCVLNRHP